MKPRIAVIVSVVFVRRMERLVFENGTLLRNFFHEHHYR
ncbi:MAG: hypothetical protein RJB04_1337 [Verrucomicrobiota bacterium]|jgi:hypothetical protein